MPAAPPPRPWGTPSPCILFPRPWGTPSPCIRFPRPWPWALHTGTRAKELNFKILVRRRRDGPTAVPRPMGGLVRCFISHGRTDSLLQPHHISSHLPGRRGGPWAWAVGCVCSRRSTLGCSSAGPSPWASGRTDQAPRGMEIVPAAKRFSYTSGICLRLSRLQ